jgi:hypothetical protein
LVELQAHLRFEKICVLIIKETETERESRDGSLNAGLLQFNQLTRLQARESFVEL